MTYQDEKDFKDRFFRDQAIYGGDNPYEVGVNTPNKKFRIRYSDIYNNDTRYIDFVEKMSPMSYADRSKPKVIAYLSKRFKENNDLGGAIYYMTLNVGYDWLRQHNLLIASGFKVTKNQVKELVRFCLIEYKKRRQEQMLTYIR